MLNRLPRRPVMAAAVGAGFIALARIGVAHECGPEPAGPGAVTVYRLPAGAIQPQAMVDSKGIVHVVFYKGPPEAGDLYYCRYGAAGEPTFTRNLVRVN